MLPVQKVQKLKTQYMRLNSREINFSILTFFGIASTRGVCYFNTVHDNFIVLPATGSLQRFVIEFNANRHCHYSNGNYEDS